MTLDRDLFEPDLDDVPRTELGETNPAYPVVDDCLGRWLVEHAKTGGHCVGTFLDWLAAEGYRVTPIPDPGPMPYCGDLPLPGSDRIRFAEFADSAPPPPEQPR